MTFHSEQVSFHPDPTTAKFLNEVDSFEAAIYGQLADGEFVLSVSHKAHLTKIQMAMQVILNNLGDRN